MPFESLAVNLIEPLVALESIRLRRPGWYRSHQDLTASHLRALGEQLVVVYGHRLAVPQGLLPRNNTDTADWSRHGFYLNTTIR